MLQGLHLIKQALDIYIHIYSLAFAGNKPSAVHVGLVSQCMSSFDGHRLAKDQVAHHQPAAKAPQLLKGKQLVF